MGHGSSVPREWSHASAELLEGSKKLSKDLNFRLAFVCFIKSGEWLDQIAVLVPQGLFVLNGQVPHNSGAIKNIISDYQMTKEKLLEVESLVSATSLKSITRSMTNSYSPSTPKSNHSYRKKLESYFNIDESPCFNGDQYLAVLFQILYPIYLASPQYRHYLKRGIEHGRAERDEDDGSMSCQSVEMFGAAASVPSPQSKRLQDILLGCAAYFDDSLLQKRLCKPDWPNEVTAALDNHDHSICVIDTHRCQEKIVYTNKSFRALSEFTSEDLRHGNLSMLNGPNTEAAQLLLLREAMQPMQTAKFAITYYNKSKRAFTDLLAVKTTEHYSVMVHFPAVKGANLDDLKEVDDLLILVSQIFEPCPVPQPAAPAAQPSASWFPAPLVNMMSHLPSPRFLPSPSFLRSRSSSTSGSVRSSGGGGGARAGGTPVSVGCGKGGTPTSAGHSTKHNPSPRSARSRGDSVRTSFSARSAAYRVEVNAEGIEELGSAEHSGKG